jgi:2'-5' RNA ligase
VGSRETGLDGGQRYFIAALFDEELSAAVDELRASLGVKRIERLAPHITVVPPFVAGPSLLRHLRDVLSTALAGVLGAHEVRLHSAGTFSQRSSVVFLEPSGAGVSMLTVIRERIAAMAPEVLEGEAGREFRPHVTLARIRQARRKYAEIERLGGLSLVGRVSRIAIMRFDQAADAWRPEVVFEL